MLVKDTASTQSPVYYVRKRLLDAEPRYPELEQVALVLITSTMKLHYYFLAHLMIVFTNHPMKQVLYKLKVYGRFMK